MDNKTKKANKKRYIIIAAAIIAVLAIIIALTVRKITPQEDVQYGNEDLIELRNIKIKDFDPYGMGVMVDDKYYTLQYGVHLADTSLIGECLGKGTGEAELTAIDGNIYQYQENKTYGIDDGASFFKFKGNDDVILVQTIGDSTVNDMWVLAPDILPKTSLYNLITNENVKIKYYPDQTYLDYSYDVEKQKEFLNSIKRVEKPEASQAAVGYMTFDDGSGLLYGADVYLDLETGEAYLSPPMYGKLTFKGSAYLYEYYLQFQEDRYNKLHSMDELEID